MHLLNMSYPCIVWWERGGFCKHVGRYHCVSDPTVTLEELKRAVEVIFWSWYWSIQELTDLCAGHQHTRLLSTSESGILFLCAFFVCLGRYNSDVLLIFLFCALILLVWLLHSLWAISSSILLFNPKKTGGWGGQGQVPWVNCCNISSLHYHIYFVQKQFASWVYFFVKLPRDTDGRMSKLQVCWYTWQVSTIGQRLAFRNGKGWMRSVFRCSLVLQIL